MREFIDALPEDVRIRVLEDLPIDARVPLMRLYPEARPKPLNEDQRKIDAKLNEMFDRRLKQYKLKRELKAQYGDTVSTCLTCIIKRDIELERIFEILIDKDNDQIKFAWRTFSIDCVPLRKTVVDFNTGESTEDWIDDDDIPQSRV